MVQKFRLKIRLSSEEYQNTSFRRLAKIEEDPSASIIRVRQPKLIAKLHETGKPVLAEGWRLNPSVRPTRSGDFHPQVI